MKRFQKILLLIIFPCFLCISLQAEPVPAQENFVQYACAFSAIFFEEYNLSHTELNPTADNQDRKNECIAILKNKWNITSAKTLASYVESLGSTGDQADYKRLKQILYNNPRLSVQGVLYTYCLQVTDGFKLFYVLALNTTLANAGINAWEYAELIAVYRCALAADFITAEDAASAIKPLVLNLCRECAGWEDFAAHYCAGAQYSAICSGTWKAVYKTTTSAWGKVSRKLPLATIPLTAVLPRDARPLKIADVAYSPSEKAQVWENVLNLYLLDGQFSDKDFQTIETMKKQFPTVPCVWYMSARAYYKKKAYRRSLSEFEAIDRLLKSVKNSSILYRDIYIGYVLASLESSYPQKAVYAFSRLSDKTKKEPYGLYLSARCSMELTGTSPDYAENEQYRKKAVDGFNAAEKAGYELPRFVKEWISEKRDSI